MWHSSFHSSDSNDWSFGLLNKLYFLSLKKPGKAIIFGHLKSIILHSLDSYLCVYSLGRTKDTSLLTFFSKVAVGI